MDIKDKKVYQTLEQSYAKAGVFVVSNDSAHRKFNLVPMVIPEINHSHLDILPEQRKFFGWDKGGIVVKPNCSIQSYMAPLYAMMQAGWDISDVDVTTIQAMSGAGLGLAGMQIVDNCLYIDGEESKTEREPYKIFGKITSSGISEVKPFRISAQCNRDAVKDGHSACLKVRFGKSHPGSLDEIISVWKNFESLSKQLGVSESELPSAPRQPILYRSESNRPTPADDRDRENGMAVTVGRLAPLYEDEPSLELGIKFVGLSHNTIRGAAGGAILGSETARVKGYL
jgi:aspartate-semialdehyde dehydrogenase